MAISMQSESDLSHTVIVLIEAAHLMTPKCSLQTFRIVALQLSVSESTIISYTMCIVEYQDVSRLQIGRAHV